MIDEFEEQVSQSTTFSIGYFAGCTSTKHWVYTEEDLRMMYINCATPDIMLWCDGRSESNETPNSKRQKTDDTFISKREEKEKKVEQLAQELKELNGSTLELSEVQYRLWARMISTGVHTSKETPPQIPMITGVPPKRKKKGDEERKTLQDSIVSTAAAVVKAVTGGSTSIQQSFQDPSTLKSKSQLGVSPGKAADIRGKSFRQLKKLYDDNVLTQEEFEDQKSVILSDLKRLAS